MDSSCLKVTNIKSEPSSTNLTSHSDTNVNTEKLENSLESSRHDKESMESIERKVMNIKSEPMEEENRHQEGEEFEEKWLSVHLKEDTNKKSVDLVSEHGASVETKDFDDCPKKPSSGHGFKDIMESIHLKAKKIKSEHVEEGKKLPEGVEFRESWLSVELKEEMGGSADSTSQYDTYMDAEKLEDSDVESNSHDWSDQDISTDFEPSNSRVDASQAQKEEKQKLHTKNTLKSNRKSARLLREYLKEKGQSIEFEKLTELELADLLEKFYLDLRRTDGQKYKASTLVNIRHALNRYMKAPPHNKGFDLIKDRIFKRANDSFTSAMVELKREGKAEIEHYPAISEEDLEKIYESDHTSLETPNGLSNKVQFDIRLYFFKMDALNMHQMTKNTFEVCTEKNGLKCVKKRFDELKKNHSRSAIMPEIPGSPRCPVASFVKYLSKLNSNNNRLWQRPLHESSFVKEKSCWFSYIPIGINTLQKFMPTISNICGLSAIYTNRSIRATGASLLPKNKCGVVQITPVTGRKNLSSTSNHPRVRNEDQVETGPVAQRENTEVVPAICGTPHQIKSEEINQCDIGPERSCAIVGSVDPTQKTLEEKNLSQAEHDDASNFKKTGKAVKRFATHSIDEVEEKKRNLRTLQAKNTLKCNRKTARVLREYLKDKGQPPEFEKMAELELADLLEKFYLDLRRTDGEKYKVSTLVNIRHALNRYLKAPPHNREFDLIKDSTFKRANDSFMSAMVELKREGKGETEHHPEISETDLVKIYTSLHTSLETPYGLSNKVQFDIRLYFFRRGAENMHQMTKTTFEVCTGEDELKYVKKRFEEPVKNHREHLSAIMPEIPGSPRCPVASFTKYLSKLNPSNSRLWQRPLHKNSFLKEKPCWFSNIPIGVNTLQKFMPTLSQRCGLTVIYSNHSIRATGAGLLSKNQFGASEIISAIDQKSVGIGRPLQLIMSNGGATFTLVPVTSGHQLKNERNNRCFRPLLPKPTSNLTPLRDDATSDDVEEILPN